jgi:uncharacterized membrane protein YkoI
MRAVLLALIVALGGAVGDARAGGMDHERARAAMESGEIMALREILLAVEEELEGRVIEVKLTDLEAGLYGWVYDVTLLTPQNNVLRVRVDAGTAVILQVEGQGIEEARKRP